MKRRVWSSTLGVTVAKRPQHELEHATFHKFGDAREDLRSAANDNPLRRVQTDQISVVGRGFLDHGVIPGAKAKAKAGAEMVVIDRPARLGRRDLDGRDHAGGLGGRRRAGEPSGPQPRRAPHRSLARSTDP